jgi:conjugal transfer mating pair stabilization protein TraG
MYDIFILGSMDLMVSVLNGVALLTNPGGPASFGTMISLGLILSILFTVTKAVITQKLEIQYFFISLVLYLAMFAPKVTVHLEDVRTGAVQNVANIPVGIAAIGSITSTVGAALTEGYETVFSIPGLTDGGYAAPLAIISALRNPVLDMPNSLETGGIKNTSISIDRSVNNYVIDCVFMDIYAEIPGLQEVTRAGLSAAGTDLWTKMNVTSESWMTTTYLEAGQPNGVEMTCKDAWIAINAKINIHTTKTLDYLGDKAGDPGFAGTVTSALDTLTGSGVTAQEFMLTRFMREKIRMGEAGYFASVGDDAMVAMLVQAMEQRQVQWAAEHTMFEQVALPLMAAIEAFFYAIGPIMIFLVMLGSFGWGLFLKYIIMGIWIQLWMPILAVNNHYILIAIQREFSNLNASGADFLTESGLDYSWTTLSTWVATGGMLAAATPLMALMVVTGSFYAFTKMTDRMHGQDHINEKLAAPDLMKDAPVVGHGAMQQNSALTTWSPGEGVLNSGFESHNISFGASHAAQVSSSKMRMQLAQEGLSNTLSNIVGHSTMGGSEQRTTGSTKHDYVNSEAKSDKMLASLAESYKTSSGQKHLDTNVLAGQFGAELGVGGGAGVIKAGVKGGLSTGFKIQDAIETATSSEKGGSSQTVEEVSRQYRKQLAEDLVNGKSTFLGDRIESSDRRALQAARSELDQATNSYNDVRSESSAMSGEIRTSAARIATRMEFDSGLAGAVNHALTENMLHGQAVDNVSNMREVGGGQEHKLNAAKAWTLYQESPEEFASIMAEHYGTDADIFGSHANSGVNTVTFAGGGEGAMDDGRLHAAQEVDASNLHGQYKEESIALENKYHANETASGEIEGVSGDAHQRSQEIAWQALETKMGDHSSFVKKGATRNPDVGDFISTNWDSLTGSKESFMEIQAEHQDRALRAHMSEPAAELFGLEAAANAQLGSTGYQTQLPRDMQNRKEELEAQLGPRATTNLELISRHNEDSQSPLLNMMSRIDGLGQR